MRKYFAFVTSPVFTLRFNIACLVITTLLLPASWIFGWLNSVPFVSVLSVVALQLSSLAAVSAAQGVVIQAKKDPDP